MRRPSLRRNARRSAGAAEGARSGPPRRTLAALDAPYFGRLWASGGLLNLTRWMALFLGSFLVNDLTSSPLLVQLVGVVFFAPMFLGGMVSGLISDHFDRRRTVLYQLSLLIPVSVVMGGIVIDGAIRTWMVYPFMFAVGLGNVLDITSRRALVYDLVGDERAANALALEALSNSAGAMLGGVAGGAVINFVGIGEGYALMAGLYAVAFALLLTVPSPPRSRASGGIGALRNLFSGFRTLRRNRTVISILGITVLVNTFYFPFIPLVPVFADRLEVNALLTGVLGSAAGIGMMVGAYTIAARSPRRRGIIYVSGPVIAMSFLFVFAAVEWYPGALLALIFAGVGISGFSTLQSTLVMVAAGPELRGRALGLQSMAIGALPFGMLILGLVAQAIGASTAVMINTAIGVAMIVAWIKWRPEARRFV
ncbi:MAG: MFS transporter [Dehalococcoidia bacterium]